MPPPWMSNSGPRYASHIATHSVCQPGRPRPHGVGHDGSPELGALPQREVALVALAGGDALALVHVVDPVAGQLAVVGQAQHVEVDVAAAGVGVPALDQPLDELDDLGDVPGGARLGRRRQHAQRVVGGR